MKISIIGRGAWGNALGILAQRAGHLAADPAADSDLWIAAVPAANFRGALTDARAMHKSQPIIICTKGMDSNLFMSEIAAQELDAEVGVLSGPQFANEVAAGLPTGSLLAGPKKVRDAARPAFCEFFLEESDDAAGAEICGCGKNACSIVAGFFARRGENERAMMISRAWREVVDFGTASGADIRTFSSLAGVGDLLLSATSRTSRNFSAGAAISRGESVAGTAEGIAALLGICARAAELNVPTPVLSGMARAIRSA
jgi:glycerol-3-phosphate dehydrogenase (NAD(P)+)